MALVISAFLTVGCQTSVTPTKTPSTNTLVSPTNTPILATATTVHPTPTLFPIDTAPVFAANAIAFFAYNPSSEKSEIKVMQSDGGNLQPIPGMSGAATFSWSPDRKRLVYIVHHGDSDWSMYIIGADGKNKVRLTQGDLDYNPTWSPDGKQIAFSRNGNLWVMRVSNDLQPVASDLRQLTTNPKECVWEIAWSPDGKQIAFDAQMGTPTGTASYEDPSTTEIYIINADGSNLRQLTNNQFIDAGPSWSPDGKQLTFFSNRDGDPDYTYKMAFGARDNGAFQIYSMAADGQNVRRLMETKANDMYPAWSADGKQIAFSSNRDGNYEIYVINADGSNPTRLTESPTQDSSPAWLPASGSASSASGEIAYASNLGGDFEIWLVNTDGSYLSQLTDNDAMDLSPAWSPDGSRLAFVSNRDGNDEIYTMNADGSDVRRLTDTPDASESFPAWSADGQLISFDSDRGNNWDVYIVNSDGSNLRRLTEQLGEDWISSWSPDGTQIAFESKRDGNYEIYVVSIDGNNPQRLTQNNVQDGAPKWSPDGSKIAFFSRRDGNPEIYVVNADGSNPLRLTNRAGDDSFPAWSADGAWLVFSSGNNQQAEIYIITADGGQVLQVTANGAQNWNPTWRPAP
jgi:Tol biopolymer transport system component